MRGRRLLVALSALGLLAGACGDDATTAPATSTTTSTTQAPDPDDATTTSTTAATVDCTGLGEPPGPDGAQITFVRDGRLHAVADVDGQSAPCLLDAATGPVLWGPAADQALVDGVLVAAPSERRSDLALPAEATFTRPTGRSVIAVVDGVLVKTDLTTGAETDVSFLARHDDVTYYPSGTHIITAGADGEGITGIWLSTNTGTDATRLAVSADTTFAHLTVSEDGSVLTFTADHGAETHVHRAPLAGDVLLTSDDEAQAETLVATDLPIVATALSRDGRVAAGYGTCDDGGTTSLVVAGWGEVQSEPDAIGWPVGFLPDGSLVVGTSDAGCFDPTAPFDLVRLTPDGAAPAEVLASDVTAAAIRIPVGEPPPPPADNPSGFV